ncbi:hypothetical protein KIN20_019695 [Parelaphostrongylus tenuis]|uniref:Uncharacterized protein n=1 Tax=Parelaphostrongylus tenuis TaxID=148309 RepID=A0AAD5MPV7_PARTN|nr:hypothetical protein KIN20_019695 [Parelaphostrongylus tenuis]
MEHVELIQHGRTDDSMAALADQLVLEFLILEITEPPAAHLARMAGTESVGVTTHGHSPHKQKNLEDFPISMIGTQRHRLLQLIRKVLERRNSLCWNIHAQTMQQLSMRTPAAHSVLRHEINSSIISGYCENCENNQQFTCNKNLVRIISLEQNLIDGITLRNSELLKAPSNVDSKSISGQGGLNVRTSQITDSKLFRKMCRRPGFAHLREDTHVLIEAKASSRAE